MSKERLTGNQCQCPACGEFFNRVSTFDKHRKGPFDGKRRCLTTAEMKERGWLLNAGGLWITAARIPEAA